MRVILPILLLVALLGASMMWERPLPRADLVVGYSSLQTLDPQKVRAEEDARVAYCLFQGLCSFDPKTFATTPGVASSWDIAPDGRTYTFHLRPGARWSDGVPLTAEDFRWSWQWAMMPDQASEYSYFLMMIRGAQAFNDWATADLARIKKLPADQQFAAARQRVAEARKKFDELVGVTVVDDHTLRVQTEHVLPYFLQIVASWPLFPVPRHTLERVTHIDGSTLMYVRDPQWTRPDNNPPTMIGNGPYRLIRSTFKRELYLVANPYFWDAARVGPKSIQFVCFNDPQSEFVAYETRGIDVMFAAQSLDFCADLLDEQRKGERHDVHAFDIFGTYFYLLNNSPTLPGGRKNPLADRRVRRALDEVIDKRALVDKVTRLDQTPADTFIPPGTIPGYHSPAGLRCVGDCKTEAERDRVLADARRELAEAGYPDGRGFPTLTILYNPEGGHRLVSEFLRNAWASELHIPAQIQSLEFKVLLDRRSDGDYMVARSGWTGDYSDPTTFLNLFRGGNGDNESKLNSPEVDRWLDEADRSTDPAARMKLLEKAEAYCMDDAVPFIPLYHYKAVHLFDPKRITNLPMHPRNMQLLYLVRVHK